MHDMTNTHTKEIVSVRMFQLLNYSVNFD